MSGIHIFCDTRASGIKLKQRNFKKMLNSSKNFELGILEECYSNSCMMATTHHGQLRSGGTAKLDNDRILVACGSFWVGEDASTLNTPMELIRVIEKTEKQKKVTAFGPFCFAYWNEKDKTLIVDADQFGVYPIYYALLNDGIIVSTRIKSIVDAGGGSGKPDEVAISEYLSIGHLTSERTLIKGVKRISPGFRLKWKDGLLNIEQIQGFKFDRDRSLDDEVENEIFFAFKRAIARYSHDQENISASLSAGLDSRMLVATAKRIGLNVHTFCMGEVGSFECEIAGEVAKSLDLPIIVHEYDGKNFTDWIEKAIWVTEEKCPPMHIHYFDGMFKGKYHNMVQLHGLLGGAIMGGEYYPSSLNINNSQFDLQTNLLQLIKKDMVYWPRSGYTDFLTKSLSERMDSVPIQIREELFKKINSNQSEKSIIEAFLYNFRSLNLNGPALCSQMLPWVDLILPYLDPKFFRLLGKLKIKDINDRKFQYRIIEKYLPECKRVPRVKDGVLLPMDHYDDQLYIKGYNKLKRQRELHYRLCRFSQGRFNLPYKKSFPYYDRWYRIWPRLRRFVSDILLSENSLSRGFWNYEGVTKLSHDLRIGRSVWQPLASMLFIEVFLQQTLDKTRIPENNFHSII